MKLRRIESTPDGGSRFDEFEVPDNSSGPWPEMPYSTNNLVLHFPSAHVRVQVLPEGLFNDWHNTPHTAQFAVLLSGKIETVTTDGVRRVRGAGSVVISDNVTGRGHTTRVVEGPAYILNVELPPDYEFKRI